MKRSLVAAAFCAAVISACAASARVNAPEEPAAERSLGKRVLTTRFTYSASVPELPVGTRALDLWIPLPSDSDWQKVRDVTIDSPVPHRITTEPKHGNRMVYVRVQDARGPIKVTVTCTVDRKEIDLLGEGDAARGASVDRGRDALRLYLEPDSKVPLGGRYGAIAEEVAGSKATPLDKARAIYEHVVATMQYDYKKESPKLGDGDVAFVCDYKKGNCSDLHSYLISLSRSQKIPAYLEYGFPIAGIPIADPLPAEGSISGYHCWVWFQDPQRGWLPLDASDGRRWLDANKPDIKDKMVGSLVLERSAAAFSHGRDIELVPAQKGAPLNYFIYPYAEADGESVKATWEVKYKVLGITGATAAAPQDLQAQIDQLRQLVQAQATEISKLKDQVAGKASSDPKAPVAVTTPSREVLQFYGFLRLDTIVDNGLTNNIQTPFFVLSPSNANVVRSGNRQISIHPRLTRTGINFTAPNMPPNMKLTGKLETDWQNGSGVTAESRPLPRIRHAYLQLENGASRWLFGQTWDLISPLFPSPNDDTLMWNAGNLGDRRPQVRYTYAPQSNWDFAVAAGLSGAIDAKDLDANGIRDGEDSGAPNVQARLGWKGDGTGLGLWAHRSWEKATKPVAGRTEFESYSWGLDAQAALGRQWDLKSEIWSGRNLSDFRGGIGQGVDPATGWGIHAEGGWIELGYSPTSRHRIATGYTVDSTRIGDIPAGGREKNRSVYLHNRWRLPGGIDLGLNYIFWETRYKGLLTGADHRLGGFVSHSF